MALTKLIASKQDNFPIGVTGTRFYLADDVPAGESSNIQFAKGDWVINLSPTAGGTAAWVCTTAGAGGTAVFKAVALAA